MTQQMLDRVPIVSLLTISWQYDFLFRKVKRLQNRTSIIKMSWYNIVNSIAFI